MPHLRYTGDFPPVDILEQFPNRLPALLSINDQAPFVSLEDSSIFPLLVVSRLPSRDTGQPLRFTITSDGASCES